MASPCLELGSPAPVSRMVPPCSSSSNTWIFEGGAASGGLTSSCVGGGVGGGQLPGNSALCPGRGFCRVGERPIEAQSHPLRTLISVPLHRGLVPDASRPSPGGAQLLLPVRPLCLKPSFWPRTGPEHRGHGERGLFLPKHKLHFPSRGPRQGFLGLLALGRRQRLGPGWAFGVNLPSCVCPGIGLLQAHQEGLGSGTQPGCSAHSTELSLYLHVLSLDYGLHALPFPYSKTKVLKSRDVPAEVEPQHLRTEKAMQVSLSETPPTICEGSCPHLWLLSPAL